MRLLKYAIWPVSLFHFAPKEVSFCPNTSCSIWPWEYVLMECTMIPICIVLVAVKMVLKYEKEVNDYIFNHIQRCCNIIHHRSLYPGFYCSIFPPTCHFTPMYHFHFTPGITFQYNAPCQLHNRVLLYQKGVKIYKICTYFYITTLRGSVTYFAKAADSGTWGIYTSKWSNIAKLCFLCGI